MATPALFCLSRCQRTVPHGKLQYLQHTQLLHRKRRRRRKLLRHRLRRRFSDRSELYPTAVRIRPRSPVLTYGSIRTLRRGETLFAEGLTLGLISSEQLEEISKPCLACRLRNIPPRTGGNKSGVGWFTAMCMRLEHSPLGWF